MGVPDVGRSVRRSPLAEHARSIGALGSLGASIVPATDAVKLRDPSAEVPDRSQGALVAEPTWMATNPTRIPYGWGSLFHSPPEPCGTLRGRPPNPSGICSPEREDPFG